MKEPFGAMFKGKEFGGSSGGKGEGAPVCEEREIEPPAASLRLALR